jgi:hypothetical protein
MRDPGRVITRESFVDELLAVVPESGASVEGHLDDMQGEPLLHLLMSDLLRLSVRTFADGQHELTQRLLHYVDRCLREGDDAVRNAVAVSFVEDFGAYPGESNALLATWPPTLRQELGR